MPSLEYDIEGSNASLQEECVRRGWYRLAVVRPQWSADRVAAELDLPNTLGVKVYYALIGNDPTTRDKYLEASIFDFLPHHQLELLNDRRAWVTLHVPKADRLGHPANIAEIRQIRRQYPHVVLVIAHLGRCYTLPHAQEALPQFADDDGLFFDISAVLNPDVHRLALKIFGPHRILYGTDNPVFYMRGRRQFQDRIYINRTNYPFFFNRDREPPEVEARYTLYMYEELLAIRRACEQLGLDRGEVESIFYRERLPTDPLDPKTVSNSSRPFSDSFRFVRYPTSQAGWEASIMPAPQGDLNMLVAVGADNRGLAVRDEVIRLVQHLGHQVAQGQTPEGQAAEYPEIAAMVAQEVRAGQGGTRNPDCSDRHGNVRCGKQVLGHPRVVCQDEFMAEMCRRYLDANVLCLSAELLGEHHIERLIETWLKTPFEGGRHAMRIERISAIERGNRR